MISVNGLSQIKALLETKEVIVEEKKTMTMEDLALQIMQLQQDLADAKAKKEVPVTNGVAKNHKAGKADPNRKYVLLTQQLNKWGKVPQQQLDLASILSANMVVGKEYSEQEVFNMVVDGAGDYKSIYSSKQDPTYLFRYYRGLKRDATHAGFVARNFLKHTV